MSRFPGSNTEYFVVYALGMFTLAIVSVVDGAVWLAGGCFLTGCLFVFHALKAWRSNDS